MRRTQCKGQSTVEMALLFAVVVAALLGMQFYIRNALSGRLKQSGDQIGQQWDADQGQYAKQTRSDTVRNEALTADGVTSTGINEQQVLDTNEQINRDDRLF